MRPHYIITTPERPEPHQVYRRDLKRLDEYTVVRRWTGRVWVIPEIVEDVEEERIDLNLASRTALTSLPGIGPATAQRIIDARPFDGVEGLIEVDGISDATLEAIIDKVRV
jgi:DNA uptake protein ComE-like DNA-binding protein